MPWPKGRRKTDEEKRTTGFAGHKHTSETLAIMSEKAIITGFQPGNPSWLGKKQSAETQAKRSVSLKIVWRDAAIPGVTGMLGKRHREESKVQIGDSNRGKKRSAETRENYKRAAERRWREATLDQRTEWVESLKRRQSHWTAGPNLAERKLLDLLAKEFPGEWKYVGNGDLILGGKCPDFANVNGRKILIELYGRYWHDAKDVPVRRRHFRQFGFSTVFVWDDESPAIMLRKLRRAIVV